MSMRPATLRTGPATTNALVRKRYVIIQFIMLWINSLLPIWLIWSLFSSQYYKVNPTRFFLMLPFHAIGWYFAWVMGAIFISKFFLIIVNLIHKPREGYFARDPKNKDFKYWCIRSVIKKFAIFFVHNFPLPWIDIIAFKMFGVKCPMKTSLFDAWVDTEFLEIGENTIIGQGSLVMSSMVTRDFLIIKKITIGDNCVIGGYSVVSPGSKIGNNVVLGTHSATTVDQELETNWVYLGVPARKYRTNEYKSHEDSDEEKSRKDSKFIKQYLTIDDLEDLEKKKKFRLIKKTKDKLGMELLTLQEKLKELKGLLVDETDEVQIRRTNRKIEKTEAEIAKIEQQLGPDKKTMRERLRIKSSNIEKLEKKAQELSEKIESISGEEQKKKEIEKLKILQSRIVRQKRIQGVTDSEDAAKSGESELSSEPKETETSD